MEETYLIDQMRSKMLQILESNQENQVSPMDIDLIKNSSDLLRRFALLTTNSTSFEESNLLNFDLNEACDQLMKTLKWRKEFGIHEMKDSDFPRELYKLNLFSYSLDKSANTLIIFVRASKYKSISNDTRDLIIRGIIHEIEKKINQFEKEYPRGIMDFKTFIILDATDISMSNIDLQLLISMFSIINNHYPSIVEKIYLYSIPWFARYLVPILLKALPQPIGSKIKQISKSEAESSLGHLLPKYMGGSSSINPSLEVPETALCLKEWFKKCTLCSSDQKKVNEYIGSVYVDA